MAIQSTQSMCNNSLPERKEIRFSLYKCKRDLGVNKMLLSTYAHRQRTTRMFTNLSVYKKWYKEFKNQRVIQKVSHAKQGERKLKCCPYCQKFEQVMKINVYSTTEEWGHVCYKHASRVKTWGNVQVCGFEPDHVVHCCVESFGAWNARTRDLCEQDVGGPVT